jgi:chaperonin GroES
MLKPSIRSIRKVNMPLYPQSDRLVVKPAELSLKRESGLFLPETVEKEEACEGTVLTVGPGKYDSEGVFRRISVKPGDRVIYSKYAGSEVKYEGVTVMIIKEHDVYAVVADK